MLNAYFYFFNKCLPIFSNSFGIETVPPARLCPWLQKNPGVADAKNQGPDDGVDHKKSDLTTNVIL